MENVWDLLFQIMKHGTNTLHIVCIFVQCSYVYCHNSTNRTTRYSLLTFILTSICVYTPAHTTMFSK